MGMGISRITEDDVYFDGGVDRKGFVVLDEDGFDGGDSGSGWNGNKSERWEQLYIEQEDEKKSKKEYEDELNDCDDDWYLAMMCGEIKRVL